MPQAATDQVVALHQARETGAATVVAQAVMVVAVLADILVTAATDAEALAPAAAAVVAETFRATLVAAAVASGSMDLDQTAPAVAAEDLGA